MSLQFEDVTEIPTTSYRKGPRASTCRDAVERVKSSKTKKVTITSPDEAELTKFYKSMVQWRIRHSEEVPVQVRKDGNVVYLWMDPKTKANHARS